MKARYRKPRKIHLSPVEKYFNRPFKKDAAAKRRHKRKNARVARARVNNWPRGKGN